MYHIFFIHSSFEDHLGSFQVLGIINMNIVTLESLLYIGASSVYMPSSGIAGSSGSASSEMFFNFFLQRLEVLVIQIIPLPC